MNNKNLQAGLILAIIALSIHTVSNYATKALITSSVAEAKKTKVSKEKTLATNKESQNNDDSKDNAKEAQDISENNDANTNANTNSDLNKNNTNSNVNTNGKTNNNANTNKNSKTNANANSNKNNANNKANAEAKLKHCYNKNGKLYYKGVCVPIPKGFTYLMNQDGFMAYADSNYNNILMIYVKEHNMDNAADGIEAFTYGFGVSELIESGPKNIVFGKNKYQLYKIKTDSVAGYSTSSSQGIKAYAYVTANNYVATYVQVLTINNNIKWAKAPLTYLSYY